MNEPTYSIGVDLGRPGGDETACVLAEKRDDQIHVLRIFRGPNWRRNLWLYARRHGLRLPPDPTPLQVVGQ